MKNRIFLGIVALVISFFLAGCEINIPDKEYDINGIKVTLEEGLKEKEQDGQTLYLQGLDMEFTALKEPFENLSEFNLTENSTEEDYAKLSIESYNLDSEVIVKDDITYFTYEKEVNGKKYFYLASVHKSTDAFYLVQYICLSKNKEKYEPKFLTWDKTVKFD